jgi:TatD DNase family protein
VVETAKILAETRGVGFDALARQTTDNFFKLFSKVPRPAKAAAADKSTQSAQANSA